MAEILAKHCEYFGTGRLESHKEYDEYIESLKKTIPRDLVYSGDEWLSIKQFGPETLKTVRRNNANQNP